MIGGQVTQIHPLIENKNNQKVSRLKVTGDLRRPRGATAQEKESNMRERKTPLSPWSWTPRRRHFQVTQKGPPSSSLGNDKEGGSGAEQKEQVRTPVGPGMSACDLGSR